MSYKKILTWPDKFLMMRAESVNDESDSVLTTIDDMIKTMEAEGVVSLAASQIGLSKQIIAVDMAPMPLDGVDLYKGRYFVAINPKIVDGFGDITISESCHTSPGESFFTNRAKYISMEYQNHKRENSRVNAIDAFSFILQRLVDSTSGMSLIDRSDFDRRQKFVTRFYQELHDDEEDLYTIYGGE